MSVAGTYSIPVETPAGRVEITLVLKVKGKSLSGCTRAFSAEAPFNDGSVDGRDFTFTVSEMTPIGPIDLEYVGTVDGDEITGQVNTPRGPKLFTGVRV
ncbi:MAG: hypothetical protein PHF56_22840 [Desulfuromonadaceae bacterium]|nr:hypothetical protein [Desulfuromonadaceae bacterium]